MGSSLAMTLPALFVKANEIEKGSVVSVIYGLDGVLVLSRFEDYEAIRERLMSILENLDERINNQNRDLDAEDI